MSGPHSDAVRAYTERRDALREAEARAARLDRRLSHARLGVFGAGALLAWLALGAERVSPLWVAAAAAVFVVLLVAHDAAIRHRERLGRARAFHEEGLHRCAGTWVGRGRSGEAWSDARHLYSADLDVFGTGSLFERLCVARTAAGEASLAQWLSAPAPAAELRERQTAVAELAGRLDLREDLAVEGQEARSGLRVEALRTWGEAPPRLAGVWRVPARVLPLVSVAALAGWLGAGLGALPFGVALVVQMGYARLLRAPVRDVLRDLDAAARDLGLASALCERVEREDFGAPALGRIQADVAGADDAPASRRIARLRRLQGLVDARRNQMFAPVAGLLLWSTNLAFAVEAWRARSGTRIAGWIDALARIEALASLATFAHEEGDAASFPSLLEDAPGVVFRARALAHPLIVAERRVANDLALDGEHRAWIVSGSNMSGKSTLLRAVGANAVLALAGAPVCAERLEMSDLHIGASIQLRDSLLEGRSRFYAEILRLRDVTRAAESGPLLFLLDEVLHGTNSRDRARGAEGVVRGLLGRGARGLLTSHDLALTRLAERLPGVGNVHFSDHLEDGELAFDYRLRPGVLERGNALVLMRAVGLDVDAPP